MKKLKKSGSWFYSAFAAHAAAFGALLLVYGASSAQCAEPDWSRVPATKITLFYPGVASWDFLTSDDHRLGAKNILKNRKNCRNCHVSPEGELDLRYADIVSGRAVMKRSGKPFEPAPKAGKKGLLNAVVKAAYDDESLYVKIEWESGGASYKSAGAKAGAEGNDRVSMQMNISNDSFKRYGCFVTCHNDLSSMPEAPSSKKVLAEPYYAKAGRGDVRLYAFYARQGWNKEFPGVELEKLKGAGGMIRILSVELAGDKAFPMSGWVFDDRSWDDAPGFTASGVWKGGAYSVVMKRPLASKALDGLSENDVISAGLAIHDDNSSKRRHYVSFPFTIGIKARADVVAVKF